MFDYWRLVSRNTKKQSTKQEMIHTPIMAAQCVLVVLTS